MVAAGRPDASREPSIPDSFFHGDDDGWFRPTEHARGPWHAGHCHAGPPTGLLARAIERLLPDKRLTRLTVELSRPIPHAGFRVEARTRREGRTVALADARIVDGDGRVVAIARGLAMARRAAHPWPSHSDSIGRPDDASAGEFPIRGTRHDLPAFNGAGVDTRYPGGQSPEPGPTTAWLRTVPLLADETPSPFQRICPLADCGNAFGRNAEPAEASFANADLTIALHRDPIGEWLGTRSAGFWEPDGIGLAEAALFDREGRVGVALQTLVLSPQGA